jgi:hypothetical protein
MINFKHHGIAVKCKPENAMQYRAAMDKPPKIKIKVDRRFDCMRRHYPKFYAGMTTTADYVREYASINDHQHLIALEYTHADRLAPTLDATAPDVLEELDPDYEYTPTIKPKAATAAQLRAALAGLIDAIEEGDPSVIARHAISAKGLL